MYYCRYPRGPSSTISTRNPYSSSDLARARQAAPLLPERLHIAMARAVVLLQLALGFCTQRSIASTAPHATYVPIIDSLLPRAECPANTFQCPTSLGAVFSDICCSSGQLCALDNNNNPACCPSGYVYKSSDELSWHSSLEHRC